MQFPLKTSLFVISVLFSGSWGMKTYNANIEQITFRSPPGKDFIDGSNLKVMGRDRVINGSFIIMEEIDDQFKFNVSFYSDSAGTGDWKQIPLKVRDLCACDGLVEYHQFLEPSLMVGVNTNFPLKGDVCPIPKGTYYLTNISIDTTHWPIQVPRGPCKGVLSYTKNDQYIGEFEIYFKIENKY